MISPTAQRFLLALVLMLSLAAGAQAQASRTWVSGVGDDANPCSRTAPCKTWAGAISKTAAGGEMNALDPGGFGAVTITKSITIDGGGTFASTLAAGTNGIVINAAATDNVILRNLSLNGNGTGLNGVRILQAANVHVENVVVFGFSQSGIIHEPTTASRLFVKDSTFERNAANGIFVKPAAGVAAVAVIDNVRLENNASGLRAEDGATVMVSNSLVSGNSGSGLRLIGTAASCVMNVVNSLITQNGGAVLTSAGVKCENAFALCRVSDNVIINNSVGILPTAGGQILSFQNNKITGNISNGTPSGTLGQT
jgi:Right handed beta helix region